MKNGATAVRNPADMGQGGQYLTYQPARPRVGDVRANANEVLGRYADLGGEQAARSAWQEITTRAIEKGLSLTAYLEEIDPSWRYNDGLDAFERQMLIAGIRTQSDPARGIFPDTVERFYQSDQPASPILYPEFINRQIRVALLVPPILDELVAITTPVDSDSYRTIYLADQVGDRRMKRVTEMSELPTVQLKTSEKAISLHKYGVRILGSYEAFRRMRLDLFSLHMARIAMQTMLDKSSEAIDTLVNGDGNSNPAANYNLTTLDSATTASHLTYYAWLRWLMKAYPYQITTVVAGEQELLAILTLQFPNINPMTILAMLTQGATVESKLELATGIWTNIRLVFSPLSPTNVLIGINKAVALEMVQEVGATLTETDRIISKQYNEITISEVVGFGQIIPQAIQTLTLNA